MITNNTYYKNKIYIPHAKPSVTSDVTTVSSDLDFFIEEYEPKCLLKCFGIELRELFYDQLDSGQPNGLKVAADAKWDDLLNGKAYTDPNGRNVVWKGIRRKALSTDTDPSVSFLANYVFFHYEMNFDVVRTGNGYVKNHSKNADERSPGIRVISAWRDMVDTIQGKEFKAEIIVKDYGHTNFGYGIDYYNENKEITLYQFIRDINSITPDTYPNFKPEYWESRVNQFGI